MLTFSFLRTCARVAGQTLLLWLKGPGSFVFQGLALGTTGLHNNNDYDDDAAAVDEGPESSAQSIVTQENKRETQQ